MTSLRGRDPAHEEEFVAALYRGGELLAAGNLAEARTHLERAHELEPKNEKAQNLLGLTYFKQGDYAQASAVYARLVDDNPADPTLRVNLGLVYLKTNELERCIHEFETATDLEPAHKKAHNYLGLALAQQGNYAKARDHFELAGSDAMVEKMTRALAAQQTAASQAVEPHTPKTVRLGEEPAEEAAPAADSIEVMSDDQEPPSDVYVVPEDAQAGNLSGDWGAQLDGAPPAVDDELPVLEAEVAVTEEPPAPVPSSAPAWLAMEAAEGARVSESGPAWVTESVAGVPPPDSDDSVPSTVVEDIAAGVSAEPPVSYDVDMTASDGEELPATADDASWATGEAASEVPATPDDSSWATGETAATEYEAASEAPATADDSSWATGETAAPEYEAASEVPATADDASWATSEEVPAAPDDGSWATAEVAAPPPSAPLPITVEEPEDAPRAAPAGYSPMAPQRLVDLGASGAWVDEPSAGPFHLSNDGLAVTVDGEMLLRMEGFVALVGSVKVTPETRRRRGRSTQEPFGTGSAQLQRLSGHGVVYLEPGRTKFHAVDLTDHNGVKIDDDGAYLREEYVFAFEEPVSFENGRLTSDSMLLELVHLKGTGRVLLQLDGNLRTMPVPVGTPLVVPLHRVVGWFGRVTPRLTGFGGRSALELTGEGYALLGAPPERA